MATGTSAVPALLDALVSQSTALAVAGGALDGVTVVDGYGVSENPGSYLFIGVADPDDADAATSATSQQAWANSTGAARDEQGTITCVALAWNGDGDPSKARADAYAVVAAVQDLTRPAGRPGDLGVAEALWVTFGDSLQLRQDNTEDGATALVLFEIAFRARL